MSSKSTAYDEVIRYLYEQLPAYQRIGQKAFKKDLGNIRLLLEQLDQPQRQFRSIHIAGTNGKGSVSNMLASILREAGYRTGIYTSPHISDFRERIQVNGKLIHKNSVIAFVRRMREQVEAIRPSFFEWTVAMAFDHFARQKVDIAVVETGLGGRLDSTNILLPELSVITNIGLEHQEMLGDTLEAIASEKAGIIKPGVPVIIGRTQRSTTPVFRSVAKANSAPLTWADRSWTVRSSERQRKYRTVEAERKSDGHSLKLKLDLTGSYQSENAVTVLTAVDRLNRSGFRIADRAVRAGLMKATLNNVFRGRWQEIGKRPRIIADSSHNADGFREVRRQLDLEQYEGLHIIYGCVKDKAIEPILDLLPHKANYYLTRPDLDRARPVDILEPLFRSRGLEVRYVSNRPEECLEAALQNAAAGDLILITGSIFLLSHFL